MSALGAKRGVVTLPGKNPHKVKVGIASKLETKEVFQLKSATNRSDVHDQLDETSIVNSDFSTGKLFYENTYKLQPDKKMPTRTVEAAVENVLTEKFMNEAYESSKCKKACQGTCELIKEKVKALVSPRFKLVVVVHVGEKKGQGVKVTSRCAWNENFDDFVTVNFTNSTIFVQATVYALYVE